MREILGYLSDTKTSRSDAEAEFYKANDRLGHLLVRRTEQRTGALTYPQSW